MKKIWKFLLIVAGATIATILLIKFMPLYSTFIALIAFVYGSMCGYWFRGAQPKAHITSVPLGCIGAVSAISSLSKKESESKTLTNTQATTMQHTINFENLKEDKEAIKEITPIKTKSHKKAKSKKVE